MSVLNREVFFYIEVLIREVPLYFSVLFELIVCDCVTCAESPVVQLSEGGVAGSAEWSEGGAE